MIDKDKEIRSPSLGSLEPLLKQVYADALAEQLRWSATVYGNLSDDPERQERIEQAKAKREKERKELLDILSTATGTLKDIVDLHSVDKYDECTGCDYGGWEGDKPSWPCRTIDLIAKELSVYP